VFSPAAAPTADSGGNPCDAPGPLFQTLSRSGPQFAYARRRGVTCTLETLKLTMKHVRLLRLHTSAASKPADTVATSPDSSSVVSRAYCEITGSGEARVGGGSGGHRGALVGIYGWDDMGSVGLIQLLQAPVPPSGGDERKQPVFVMAENAHLVLTESTRCAPPPPFTTLTSTCSFLMAPVMG
jgi:hypothetical protein